jgi:hypothetical protein
MTETVEDKANLILGRDEVALALFALGSFVQHRLEDGMPKNMLVDFMQAYRVIWARLEGRAFPAPREQQFQKEAASQEFLARLCEVWPPWLSDDEKLQVILPSSDSQPCMSTHRGGM